jgi:hypothetical protein
LISGASRRARRKLKTLAEAMTSLAKEIPKSAHKMEKVQTAAHCVTRAAEHGGPMIFAQMGMLRGDPSAP